MDAQVALPRGESGSHLLHRVVEGVARTFADALPGLAFPQDGSAFKKAFGDALSRFESARLASPKKLEIARALCNAIAASCELEGDQGRTPLFEVLSRKNGAEHATQIIRGDGTPALTIEIPFEGKTVRGDDALALVEKLHADHHMTTAALEGLRWILLRAKENGGVIDLRGKKFAMLGAAAELSPAPLLLKGGASVLWIDPHAPKSSYAGTVVRDESARDLLREPAAIAHAIETFANGEPTHVGMFAYAPGKGRELRLAETMNAITERLRMRGAVASVSMFVSPTSPAAVQPEDVAVVRARAKNPASWQRALELSGVVKGPGFYGDEANAVARAVIMLQGAAYQAAQYVSKSLRAEVWAHDGLRVSANVAGISRTKSLEHPLFLAAFEGAPSFGVRIFDSATTRALATLLMLSDLLREPAPPTEVHTRQIHGGVYDVPWQFEASVRAAAVLGAAKKPAVLFRRKSGGKSAAEASA